MLTSTATLEPAYRAFGFRPVREPDEVRLDHHSAHASSHLADPLDHRANSDRTSQRFLISLGAGPVLA